MSDQKNYEEGDCCDMEDCPGVLGYEPVENCSWVCLHCGWVPGEDSGRMT